MQLVPHLLLRTNSERSEAAVVLRNGNYLVSRIADDDLAVALSTSPHVDGVVVDLPLFAAIGFATAVLSARPSVPLLIVSHSPEVVRRTFMNVEAAHAFDVSELVTIADLMLARHPSEEAMPARRAAAG